jgi:soluble lytic murein transglycosylase-like protein
MPNTKLPIVVSQCSPTADRMPVWKCFFTILLAGKISALAQDADAIRAAMSAGLEKQRASIAKQTSLTQKATAGSVANGFFALPWSTPPPSVAGEQICDPVSPEVLGGLIDQAAQREQVEAGLVRAVIKQESGGRACAVSPKGAQGIMQLMPDTAAELGVADAFDPKQNIDGGVKLLKSLLTKYSGNTSLALAAYNAGIAAVDKGHAVPDIPETLNYVSDILEQLTKKKP